MKLGKIVAVLLACIFALGLLACKKTDDLIIDIGGSASPNQTDASATQQGSVADSATPNSGLSTSVPTSEVTSDINPTPNEAPDTESIVSLGSETAPARNTMPTETYGLSNTECESWFSDAVFIGDSITIGWKDYNNRMLEKIPNSSEIRAFSAKAATVSDMRSSRFRIPACIPFTVENNAIFGTPLRKWGQKRSSFCSD